MVEIQDLIRKQRRLYFSPAIKGPIWPCWGAPSVEASVKATPTQGTVFLREQPESGNIGHPAPRSATQQQ